MNRKNLQKIISLRHELHQYPELSMQETGTKKRLMEFLKKETDLEITDCGYWFYALYRCGRGDEETVAFRADFDAVAVEECCQLAYISRNPGVGHKCGHDGHSASLAGLALEVDQNGADKNICFIFQHAEETGQGARECVSVLKEQNISGIFAYHNWSGFPRGSILVREGVSQCASIGLTVSFRGKASHASLPEDGKNPAAAVAQMILFAENIKNSRDFDGLVLCTVIHGEIGQKNFGVSPGNGEVSFTLRAFYERDLERLEQSLRDTAEKTAQEEGLSVYFQISDPFPETVNDAACVGMVRSAAQRQKRRVIELKEPFRASEDFGYFTKMCPGAIFYIGNGENYPPLHTPEYDFDDGLLETAVDMFLEILKG